MFDNDETELRRRSAKEHARDVHVEQRIERLELLWSTARKTWVARMEGTVSDSDDADWFLTEAEWARWRLCSAAIKLDKEKLASFLREIESTSVDAKWGSTKWEDFAKKAVHHPWHAGRESALCSCLILQGDEEAAIQKLARLLDAAGL